jgi:hypothetical protein
MLLTEANNKPKRLFTTVIQTTMLKVQMMTTSLTLITKAKLKIKLNLRFSSSHSVLTLMKKL